MIMCLLYDMSLGSMVHCSKKLEFFIFFVTVHTPIGQPWKASERHKYRYDLSLEKIWARLVNILGNLGSYVFPCTFPRQKNIHFPMDSYENWYLGTTFEGLQISFCEVGCQIIFVLFEILVHVRLYGWEICLRVS